MSRESLIAKITALFAKANSTEYAPEQAALLAKAQTLITRYQIDEEELRTAPGVMIERSVMIEGWGNATRGVVRLYLGVAGVNRCSGAHRSARARSEEVLFGTETDLEVSCALAEHLLPQLRLAILNDRPRSRMSYSIGWADEVLTRLRGARETAAAETNALVPTNTEATEALRSAHQLRSERRPSVDGAEYGSGIDAGGQVDLGGIKVNNAPTPELG